MCVGKCTMDATRTVAEIVIEATIMRVNIRIFIHMFPIHDAQIAITDHYASLLAHLISKAD
jgi:hypothetical protein